jgi:hypothetical protein
MTAFTKITGGAETYRPKPKPPPEDPPAVTEIPPAGEPPDPGDEPAAGRPTV